MRTDLWVELVAWIGLALASTILGMLLVGSARAGPIELEGAGAFEWRITSDTYPVPSDDPPYFSSQVFVANHLDDCLYAVYEYWSIGENERPIPITFPTSGRCEVDHFVRVSHEGKLDPSSNSYYAFTAWLIPEPSPLALIGLGLIGIALKRLRA